MWSYKSVCLGQSDDMTTMKQTTKSLRAANEVRRSKAANRESEHRAKLIEVGTHLFVERGMSHVSVEDLIEAAGVSRATFYGFFANKDELAASILMPVFESGVAAMEKLTELAPAQAAEGLIDVYLLLWRKHKNALLFTTGANESVFPYIKQSHHAFSSTFKAVLQVIHSGGLLRNNSVDLTYAVLAKTGIPLLRVYQKQDNMEHVYRESLLSLILRPGPQR